MIIHPSIINDSSWLQHMLITLVNTKTAQSKFVLHKYPYEKISLDQLGLQKSSMSDIQTALAHNFDEFGTYRKKSLINTSSAPIPASAVLEIFIANEKNSQLVVGIDDDCVLVSRSVILANKSGSEENSGGEGMSGENYLMDVTDECESIVNSLTLIWQLDSFDGVEEAKHRISFLLGVLERKEKNSRYLTKEIKRVQAERAAIIKHTKNLVAINTKDSSKAYEDIRIKIITREIDANARRVREQIGLFEMLREYYQSWISGKQFEVREERGVWEGTIGRRVSLQSQKKSVQQKTLVMLPPKLAELLPSALYSDRVKNLYKKGFTYNHLSFRKLLQRGQVNPSELYHTVYFLLRNNLAVDIYPINPPHSYNLFFLRNVPSRALIQKFNQRIFPGKSFLQVALPYSNYKLAREEEETLKYLLLKELVGEVRIHVYRKCQREQDNQNGDAMLEELLSKYSLTEKDLNHLLAVQPFAFSKQSSLLNNIIRYIKDHHRQWGFFFLE